MRVMKFVEMEMNSNSQKSNVTPNGAAYVSICSVSVHSAFPPLSPNTQKPAPEISEAGFFSFGGAISPDQPSETPPSCSG